MWPGKATDLGKPDGAVAPARAWHDDSDKMVILIDHDDFDKIVIHSCTLMGLIVYPSLVYT